ncbi:MAG: hypothetical protein WCA10_15235 [Terracidiphilus sp.]
MNPFESEVHASLDAILKNPEPDYCQELLGTDKVSVDYPPHKAVRLVVSLLFLSTWLVLETLLLIGALVSLSALMLPLSMLWRATAALAIFVALPAIALAWFPKHLFPSMERAWLYWWHNAKRRNFTIFELSRLNHVFSSHSVAAFTWTVCIGISALAICLLLLFRWWLWGALAMALALWLKTVCRFAALSLSKRVIKTFTEIHGDDIDEVAQEAADAGSLPGDRTPRSYNLRGLRTMRRLRMPAIRCSFLLAYATGLSYFVTLGLVFTPVMWFALHNWVKYTPGPQIAMLAAVWLLVRFIRIYKAKDNRQFQSILLRPFQATSSEYAKNAILPVLGSVGGGITVEDSSFRKARLRSIPFAVRLDVVAALNSMIPYIVSSDWKTEVDTLIAESDVAVVDVTKLTEDIIWEIERCFNHLPSCRIIFIVETSCFENVVRLLPSRPTSSGETTGEPPRLIRYERSFRGRLAFKWKLLQVFRQIQRIG